MAEAWRLEEDEEELKELRRRLRRVSLNPATDRSERNKADNRSSGPGPLSSIKAAIKRTSRTSAHSEQQRERRRPEITIVAAEPLGPSSWFPGGPHVPQQGLVFQSSHTQASWRTNELVPAEPPSYEQVIKEINQVQVNTTSNNNATSAANSRCTVTTSTQTDFPEEIISSLPGINVKTNLHALHECETTSVLQIPRKPPRPSSSLLNSNPSNNEELLVILEEQTCQEKPNTVICPVPKPRLKGNLKPVVRDPQNNAQDNQDKASQSRSTKETSSVEQLSLLDDSFWEIPVVLNNLDMDKSQNSIVSRIKAFEQQVNTETPGLTKKPDLSPRSLGPRPVVSAKKPVVAPKPGLNRVSGEWDSWTESKVISQEKHFQPQGVGNNVVATKPELPKKPKPGIVKSSSSNGLVNAGSRSENSEGYRKSPTPAPRPLVPKKSLSFESSFVPVPPLKPGSAAPRISVASQSNAFSSVRETPASNLTAAPLQSTPSGEGDLISFDDDVLLLNSFGTVQELTCPESDLAKLSSKNEPAKEQAVQSTVVRKPTVIRIPAKSTKSLHEVSESPPPLPTEKPIGITSSITSGKPNNSKTTKKGSVHLDLTRSNKNELPLPPRPVDGKIMPARPPPPKSAPGRPPPPKSIRSSSQMNRVSRSSSDMMLHKKNVTFGLGVKRTKSQDIKSQDPTLPPRPKPGHPLYNKYMLPALHGTAKENVSSEGTGPLSCKDSENTQKVSDTSAPYAVVLHDFLAEHSDDLDLSSGETVYLLEKIDDEWYRGKCKNRIGIFPSSFVKVIVDIPGESNRKKVQLSSPNITGPRCMARFEYIGDQKDELSFSEGEIITLKEYVNEEWAKGELRNNSGIFPLNFVEVIEDLPEPEPSAPVRNKREKSASLTQMEGNTGEWCDALHDFTAEAPEDLSFKKGDRILILEHLDSEWCKGRLNGKEGIFPAVFVHVCSGGIQSSKTSCGKKAKAKALYDFHAENADELSFKVGDVVTELQFVDEDWMSGELHGKSGIFPRNFVQILQPS